MNKNNRNPVLLVHGIYNTSAKFNTMKKYLTNLGWSVHCFSLKPNNGNGHLEKLAQQVYDYINNNFSPLAKIRTKLDRLGQIAPVFLPIFSSEILSLGRFVPLNK